MIPVPKLESEIIDPSATGNERLYQALTTESQIRQSFERESKSVEPKARHQNFLKKGDKSRVYDPKEVIKQHKKSQAEYKTMHPELENYLSSSHQSMVLQS